MTGNMPYMVCKPCVYVMIGKQSHVQVSWLYGFEAWHAANLSLSCYWYGFMFTRWDVRWRWLHIGWWYTHACVSCIFVQEFYIEYSLFMQGGGHWNERGWGSFSPSKGGIWVGMLGGLHFLCTQWEISHTAFHCDKTFAHTPPSGCSKFVNMCEY